MSERDPFGDWCAGPFLPPNVARTVRCYVDLAAIQVRNPMPPIPDLPPRSGGLLWGPNAIIQEFDGEKWVAESRRVWRDGAWRDA